MHSNVLAGSQRRRILVLGATGMLGNVVLRYLSNDPSLDVVGTVRSDAGLPAPLAAVRSARIVSDVNVDDRLRLERQIEEISPSVVVNCVGVVKQLLSANDPLTVVPINSLLPHVLARICSAIGARLIHVSTDCVFSGERGRYREGDTPDARDLYGRSKLLGEVDAPGVLTLRTSIIGPELRGGHGLLEWFLAQPTHVNGYVRAVFSGLPTVEFARVIHEYVLPDATLDGIYHVGGEPITKYELLRLIASQYGLTTELLPDESVVIDRSLDTTRFRDRTGYVPPSWHELVRRMRAFG